jgi:hypothetical protein
MVQGVITGCKEFTAICESRLFLIFIYLAVAAKPCCIRKEKNIFVPDR